MSFKCIFRHYIISYLLFILFIIKTIAVIHAFYNFCTIFFIFTFLHKLWWKIWSLYLKRSWVREHVKTQGSAVLRGLRPFFGSSIFTSHYPIPPWGVFGTLPFKYFCISFNFVFLLCVQWVHMEKKMVVGLKLTIYWWEGGLFIT